jgi:ElaB/YqjD/DUF883 family membrane-anchored ribosome-binding protein
MQQHEMTNRSADQIAAQLDRDRALLTDSIDQLRDRLSANALMGDAVAYAKSNVGQYAQALDGAVRAHPLAAAMAGIGLAWLVFGRRRATTDEATPLAGTKFEALSRWEDEGGPVAPLPDVQDDDSWIAEADALRNRALDALARIDAAAREKLRPLAEIVRERAEVLAELARSTKAAMLRGLEGMGTEPRDRILAVREKAYAARLAAVRQGTQLIEERPMVAGAIGMAIGAAVAAVLPTTETEDRVFGGERDRLLRHAQDALRDERARASGAAARLAGTVASDVKNSARDLVSEAL